MNRSLYWLAKKVLLLYCIWYQNCKLKHTSHNRCDWQNGKTQKILSFYFLFLHKYIALNVYVCVLFMCVKKRRNQRGLHCFFFKKKNDYNYIIDFMNCWIIFVQNTIDAFMLGFSSLLAYLLVSCASQRYSLANTSASRTQQTHTHTRA